MKSLSQRMVFFISLLAVFVLFGIVAYLEKYKGFTPCPLCLLQRYVLILMGILFFMGAIFKFKKPALVFLNSFALFFSLLGILLAGRQVWLQHLPPNQFGDCGASLEYMLQALPIQEVLQKVFAGSAECSQVGSAFLYLSLAEWSLIAFCLFFLVEMWQLIRLFLNNQRRYLR